MAKTKGKPESGNKNIWQKNGIPPLAFCSIGRAAELLTCQEEDIYHWINTRKIFPAVCIEAGVNIKVSVTMQDGGASVDEIISRIHSVVSKPSKIAISECNTPERRAPSTITDLEMQRLIESLPPPPNRFELTATIAGLWEPPLYEPWREGVEKVIDPQGLLFPIEFKSPPDLLISFHPAERITIPAASLMIVREDVEKIYQAGLDGVEMDDLPFRNQIAGFEQENTSAMVNNGKVGDLLDMLIRCVPELGGEVMTANPNKRHDLLAQFLETKQKEGKFTGMRLPASSTIEKYFKI